MRYAIGHKTRTRTRILETAARLFRRKGYTATGVDAVMAAAGLTAGGFYAHFRSKQAMLAEALDLAFQQSIDRARSRLASSHGADWIRGFITFYLSKEHRDAPERGCPMPALASEVARLNPACRAVFEKRLQERLAAIEAHAGAPARSAIPGVALSVGALVLARAVSNRDLSDRILEECRAALLRDISRAEARASS